MVAALYVLEKSSPYRHLDVDLWPKSRDATTYGGPGPVVAHPPCGPWSKYWAHVADDSTKPLAPIAVDQVRRWGGILEHPAHSGLWKAMGLPPASRLESPGLFDDDLEFSIEVEQCWWGHISRKRTWLYMVGIRREDIVLPPPIDPPPPARIVMRNDGRGRRYRRAACDFGSPESRKRSPPEFARWLVDLAAKASPPGSRDS